MASHPGPFERASTDLFRSIWHPKKSVTILWRRVDTISPAAYEAVLEWARAEQVDDPAWPWLEAMATNEATVDAVAAVDEIERLVQRRLPAPLHEQAELLRDLIWEASESTSDWLNWRPCRICGRRWATLHFEGVILCPRHAQPAAVLAFWRDEMEQLPGLVDHSARIAALSEHLTGVVHQPLPPLPISQPIDDFDSTHDDQTARPPVARNGDGQAAPLLLASLGELPPVHPAPSHPPTPDKG